MNIKLVYRERKTEKMHCVLSSLHARKKICTLGSNSEIFKNESIQYTSFPQLS